MLILSTWIPGGLHGQGPPVAPTTRIACPPGKYATISSLPVVWGKVQGCWGFKCAGSHPLLLYQPEMSPPYPRTPGGGAPVAGDILIPIHFPLPSASRNHCIVHSQFARSARASGRPHPPWHLSPGSLCLRRVPSPLQMLLPLLSSRAQRLGPHLDSAPAVRGHLGAFCPVFRFPVVGSCLGIFLSSGGPQLSTSMVTGASAATRVVAADRVAHPLYLFEHCCHHKDLLVDVPHHSQHPLTWILFHCYELPIGAVVSHSKLWPGIRPRDIGQHSSTFALQLCGWPLKQQVFSEWVKDILSKMLLSSLFPPASSG